MSAMFQVHLQTNKQRHNNTQLSNIVLDTVCSMCSGGFKLWSYKHTYESKGVYAAPQNESPAYYVPILILRPPSGDSLTLNWHTALFCVTASCRVRNIVELRVKWNHFIHPEQGKNSFVRNFEINVEPYLM